MNRKLGVPLTYSFVFLLALLTGVVNAKPLVSAQVIAKIKSGLAEAQFRGLVQRYGSSIIKHRDGSPYVLLRVPPGLSEQDFADIISRQPQVEMAAPNFLGRGAGDDDDEITLDSLDDPYAYLIWQLRNDGQFGGIVGADVNAEGAWDKTTGSSKITVAILNTGLDLTSTEFQGRTVPGWDFVNEDNDPTADHPHGIAVASVMGANADNEYGVAGIDHRARIMPLKVLNQNNGGTTFDLIDAIRFAADNDADVISMSLVWYPGTNLLKDALGYARSRDVINVACAGTANGDNGSANSQWPGASPDTISVGATTDSDSRASYSSTGAALDVVAPGHNVVTVNIDLNSMRVIDGWNLWFGCSFATPLVAVVSVDVSIFRVKPKIILGL